MMMNGLSRNFVGDAGDGSIKPRLLQLSGQTGAAKSGFDSLPGEMDSSGSVRPSGLAQHPRVLRIHLPGACHGHNGCEFTPYKSRHAFWRTLGTELTGERVRTNKWRCTHRKLFAQPPYWDAPPSGCETCTGIKHLLFSFLTGE